MPVRNVNMTGACELIDDGATGYLRGDLGGLAACLPRTRDLDRRRCREEARRRFTADRMVAEHLDLYAELLQGRRARPARR